MALTDYAEDKLLQHVFLGTPWNPPASVYLALFTDAPTDLGTDGTEVTGGSYARQQITFTLASGGAGKVTNTAALTFSDLPACTVVSGGIYDAATNGNLLAYADLSSPVTVAEDDNLSIAAGLLNFFLG